MPDIELIYNDIQDTHFTWSLTPNIIQYWFEANIFSWGFLHV